MNRRIVATLLVGSMSWCNAACTNDFDQFEFEGAAGSGETGTDGTSSTGGGGSTSQGSGGQPDTGGSADACDYGQILCAAVCVTAVSDAQCGGCTNDCTQQGEAGGLACNDGACGCTVGAQCGANAACSTYGTCQCGSTTCRPGESCNADGACSCNGASACAFGEVCCQSPAGCADLDNDSSNCGACGRSCPAGQSCVAGTCP